MSGLLRKIDNLIRVGTIVEVNLSASPAMVRIEVDEGVKSDWMPFSQAFIGQTMIWCAPKIGMSGLVVSEGGENRVNRFFPCFNDSSNAPALGEDDFKIFLKNGDSIYHNSGSGILTINSASQVIVNSKKADVNAPKITLNGDVEIIKTLTVKGFTNLQGGFSMTGTGKSGTVNIPINFTVDPTINGTKYSAHTHSGVQSGGSKTGGVS